MRGASFGECGSFFLVLILQFARFAPSMLRPVCARLLYSPEGADQSSPLCSAVYVNICACNFYLLVVIQYSLSRGQSSDKVGGWRSQCAYRSREIFL
jgi:hypothetical protein